MAQKSSIEWTDSSWNPATGCTKISDGCKHCYAEKMALRLRGMGQNKYRNGFDVTLHPDALDEPLKWTKRNMIFVCSMGDLFHEDVPDAYIKRVFHVMNKAKQHTFQVLTKRSSRLPEIAKSLKWSNNIWLGVTVESSKYQHRINDLKMVPAKIKFLSLEPLLSDLPSLNLDGIDWVIVGGESGAGARPISKEWVFNVRNQCEYYKIPFFFKQWGGVNKKAAGKMLDGRIWNEMPKGVYD